MVRSLSAGGAEAQRPAPAASVPTRRGGGGDLKILMWDAPTMLNPHFGRGLRDLTASRLFYEPLAAPQGDGTFRATGWVEDLLPGDGAFSGPDGGCVTWYLYSEQSYETFTTMACPHFSGPAKVQINEVVESEHPITRASLGTFWA